ncbi:hypothetical protein P3S68_011690 [Capsicum galapagoense]
MVICKWVGYPDLFITFTCIPKWPEITRFVGRRGLNTEDRPDILSRIFKIKLDHLIKNLKANQVFGKVKAVIYTIEFQKKDCLKPIYYFFLMRAINFLVHQILIE